MVKRASVEKWTEQRAGAYKKVTEEVQQKTADAIADNAALAQDIKRKLLLRLQRIEAKYPMDATEVRTRVGSSTAIYRIRDLAAAFKDLTSDLTISEGEGNALLQSLIDLERRAQP